MSELKPCPFCGMGLTLDIDEEGGVAILHSLKGEKNCWFPSIVEIEMPVETTLEEMVEILNRRPIQESFEHALVGASLVAAARPQDKDFEIQDLKAENERLSQMLHDELSQLEIATDLGNKRWVALNEIYEDGEKHNANWCKRKAQEGLGIKNA